MILARSPGAEIGINLTFNFSGNIETLTEHPPLKDNDKEPPQIMEFEVYLRRI